MLFLSYIFSLLSIKVNINPPIKIGIFGDIMFSRKVGYFQKENKNNWVFSSYNPFKNINQKDFGNLWIGNLESPLVYTNDNDKAVKTFIFRANHKNIDILKQIKNNSYNKILILNLANNHIRNGKKQGFLDTKDILTKNKIYFVGVGLTPQESHKILKLNINNQNICFQGYSYDGTYKWGLAVNSLRIKHIKKDLEQMKKLNCDKKIILVHWGLEYKVNPTKFQKNLAHQIIDNGADLIVGGHSHILGKIEKYKGKTIIYSLGNAIFDQNWGQQHCFYNMDCIKNKKGKLVTPTFIGTLLVYNTLKNNFNLYFHKINFGKLEKLEDETIENNLKKLVK